jgi:hypothetical protein
MDWGEWEWGIEKPEEGTCIKCERKETSETGHTLKFLAQQQSKTRTSSIFQQPGCRKLPPSNPLFFLLPSFPASTRREIKQRGEQ